MDSSDHRTHDGCILFHLKLDFWQEKLCLQFQVTFLDAAVHYFQVLLSPCDYIDQAGRMDFCAVLPEGSIRFSHVSNFGFWPWRSHTEISTDSLNLFTILCTVDVERPKMLLKMFFGTH